MTEETYSPEFYNARQEGSKRSADHVSRWLCELLAPKSVLDVGCGTGSWLAAFKRNGVTDIWGLDGDWVPRDKLEIPLNCFRVIDLQKKTEVGRCFDLAVCLEVAEHLDATCADAFTLELARSSNVILFSAAVPGQGGCGHVNERWQDYWIERFQMLGFVCVDIVRGKFWNDKRVAWWYSQNAFLFVAKDKLSNYPALIEAEKTFSMGCKPIVHPELFMQQICVLSQPLNYSVKEFVKCLPERIIKAIWNRIKKVE